MWHTFECFVPFLHFQDSFIEIVVAQRPLIRAVCSLISGYLPFGRNHPRVSEKLLRGDAEVGILLETVI